MTLPVHRVAKRHLAASPVLCTASAVTQARTPNDERGCSYFMALGAQRITYRESPSIVPVKSLAKVTNPLLITGAVYALHADSLLSLDSESTFAPGTATERWTATVPVINNVALTDPVLQTNRFSLHESTTRLMLHYRVRETLFALGGPSFHSQSFKRFGFAAGADNVVALPAVAAQQRGQRQPGIAQVNAWQSGRGHRTALEAVTPGARH